MKIWTCQKQRGRTGVEWCSFRFLLVLFLCCWLAAAETTSRRSDDDGSPRQLRGAGDQTTATSNIFQRSSSSSVRCRLILVETLLETGESLETPACVPLQATQGDDEDDWMYTESDDVIDIPPTRLPHQTWNQLRQEGTIHVHISHAELQSTIETRTARLGAMDKEEDDDDDDEPRLHLSDASEFSIINSREDRFLSSSQQQFHNPHHRHLKKAVNGTLTVAVVRISTLDRQPTPTVQDMLDMQSSDRINFVTQYAECSMNKLRLRPRGVYSVTVPRDIVDFGTSGGGKLVAAAQRELKRQYRIDSITELADRVLLCLPPGTGSWVASAGNYHWRSVYNDEWCTSLTATMHEIGHTIGLQHSNEDGEPYADRTGYMSRARKNKQSPQRCFNGQNNAHLQWYHDRERFLANSTTTTPVVPKEIRLAAFVDYRLTERYEPVLVNIAHELYVQYNRAKGINRGTGEYRNTVTVTTKPQNGGSQLVAALKVGETYSVPDFYGHRRTLVIQVCEGVFGNLFQQPDYMLVSMGERRSACRADRGETGNWILKRVQTYRKRQDERKRAAGVAT